jgi:hypothetical protein
MFRKCNIDVNNWGMPDFKGKPHIEDMSDVAISCKAANNFRVAIRLFPGSGTQLEKRWYDVISPISETFEEGPVASGSYNFSAPLEGMWLNETPVALGSTCTSPGGKDGQSIQRVGPFHSTGGYDWWHIVLSNIGGLADILKNRTLGVNIIGTAVTTETVDGNIIRHPPLHHHHFHIPHSAPAKLFDAPFIDSNSDSSECVEEMGGLACASFKSPLGYGILVNRSMQSAGIINDVRPPGSQPLVWYLALRVRWISHSNACKPLSFLHIINSWPEFPNFIWNPPENVAGTFPAPAKYDSMYWYSIQMPIKGKLIRAICHTHENVDELLLFAARPQQLGLHSNDFPAETPLRVNSSLHSFRVTLFSNLAQHSEEADPQRTQAGRLICGCSGIQNEIDGVLALKVKPTCCEHWTFSRGEVVTIIGLMHQSHSISSENVKQHLHIHMYYEGLTNFSSHELAVR